MNNNKTGYVGGVLNLTGVRPGQAFKYEGPTFPKMPNFVQTVTSTYEAIERLILPPPLKVDRDFPPEFQIIYFTNVDSVAYDGRPSPYHACMFMARTKHNGVSGRAGWEYVDSISGDKTEIDWLAPCGVYFGMLKKTANIHFVPVGGNEFEMTVIRRGVRLVKMRIGLGSELSDAVVAQINAANAESGDTLVVRELPNENYSGLAERSICLVESSKNVVSRAWSAEAGAVEFGHLELDPMDELPVLGVSNALVMEVSTEKELFTTMRVLEQMHDDA